jgi:hypothetical protein
MSDRSKKISELNGLTNPAGGDYVLVVDAPGTNSAQTMYCTVTNLFNNCSSNLTISNTSVLSTNNFTLRRSDTPSNSTITVARGTMWFDENFLYVAVSENILKRVSLDSF